MAAMADLDSMRTWRGFGGMGLLVYVPPEPDVSGIDVERRFREARLRIEVVVAARRDVVGRVRMEDRGQQLDLSAADAELVLPAAVGTHPALLAELVGGEQRLHRAEA